MTGKQPSLWTILKVWLYFFLPFLPGCPKIGNGEDGDCLFVQAFGRNDYPDEGLGKRLIKLREQARGNDPSVFITLAHIGFNEGDPNRELAIATILDHEQFGDPIQAQWEVVFSIFVQYPDWYASHRDEIDVIWPPADGYFSTDVVKQICKEKALKRGCARPRELAHPAMKVRAIPIIWKLGLNPIVTAVSPFSFWKDRLWQWDQDSIQEWIKGFVPWLKREIPGRLAMVAVSIFPALPRYLPASVADKLPKPCLALKPQTLK